MTYYSALHYAAKAEKSATAAAKSAEDTAKYAETFNPDNIVNTSTNQTISGVKTFNSSPILKSATPNTVAIVTDEGYLTGYDSISRTELGYLDGVTSNIQTQLNGTVKTSGDQTINGTKTFTNAPKIVNTSGRNMQILLSDTTANSEIGLMQATSNGKNQFLIRFANGNKYPFVISQDPSDNTKFNFTITSSPAATSNTNEIATTAWVRSKAAGFPNYSAAVSIADSTTSYTPPSNGIIQMGYLSAGDNTYSGGVTHSSGVDMVSQYSAYKYSNGGTFWCIVEKGVKYTLTASQPNKKFIPFK